jgi:hypothetical protein
MFSTIRLTAVHTPENILPISSLRYDSYREFSALKSTGRIHGVGRSDGGLLRLAAVIGTADAKQMLHEVNTRLSTFK